MKMLHTNGQTVAFRHRTGRGGPCVVFVNPLGAEQCIWDEVIAALPSGFDTLTYDLRGHGLSGSASVSSLADLSRDVICLVEALNLTDVILCGTGVGGMVAQVVGSSRPDWLTGLALTGTATTLGNQTLWTDRIAAAKEGGMQKVAEAFSGKGLASDANAKLQKNMLLRVSPATYTATCEAIRDADLTEVAVRIQVPTLCIASNDDPLVPVEAVAALTNAIQGARLEVLPNAGPMPMLEVPDKLAALIGQMAQGPAIRSETGMTVRREVLGQAHVNRAEAAKTDFDEAFQTLITEGAWGTVWASPGISRRDRSMLTVALLAALGNFDEIPMHIRATRRTGATPRDLQEAFQHVAIYAGVPRANHALKLARQALAEMEEEHHD